MNAWRIVFGFVLLSAGHATAQRYTISTYAGGGPQPPGMGIGVNVRSITTDAAGNVYFASPYSPSCTCVFKLDTNGNLTRIAGGAQAGFAGDGGPAVKALLNDPIGLAVDSAGDVFIAEGVLYNSQGPYSVGTHKLSPEDVIFTPQGGYRERVRKVTPDGIINTVAGGGAQGFSGDGGPATSASFFGLSGIAVDAAGNLYIADGLLSGDDYTAGNNRIRIVTPDGIINTVAGTGAQGFSGDGGPAANAQINGPAGLTGTARGISFFRTYSTAASANCRLTGPFRRWWTSPRKCLTAAPT